MFNNGNNGNSSPVLINCVLNGNYASVEGGAMFNFGSGGASNTILYNSIIWNHLNTFENASGATTTLFHSIIETGGFTTLTFGSGINNNKPEGYKL